jgi:hypothetical protein
MCVSVLAAVPLLQVVEAVVDVLAQSVGTHYRLLATPLAVTAEAILTLPYVPLTHYCVQLCIASLL